MPKREKYFKGINDHRLELLDKSIGINKIKDLLSKHCSYGMIHDLLRRDFPNVACLLPSKKESFNRFLKKNGFYFDLQEYNKKQNWWKLQYRYPDDWTEEQLRKEQRRLAQKGQKKTVEARKKKENYNPKQSLDYWIKVSESKQQAEDAYLLYKRKNSPFSEVFYTSRGYTLQQAKNIISQKSAERGLRGLKKTQKPKTEKLVKTWLLENEFQVSPQFKIQLTQEERKYRKRQYVYDFYVPELNLVIECCGDYWHANPVYFDADDEIKFPGREVVKAKDVWAVDEHKMNVALDRNFRYAVLWESDIKNESIKKNFLRLLRNWRN